MQGQVAHQAADAVQHAAGQVTFLGIRIEGWLTILAILLGPIVALGLQRNSERRREQRARKLNVFKELMATRAAKVSARHVEALNAIEIEFSSGRGADKRVTDAWRLYLDHLNDRSVDPQNQDALARWGDKGNDLLVGLLYEMSKALNFEFDKVSLKNSVYAPRAHGELETDQTLLRKFLLEIMAGKRAMWTGVFTGDRPLQMEVLPPSQPAEAQLSRAASGTPENPASSTHVSVQPAVAPSSTD